MSGTVVIVVAALIGWCLLSLALALVVGRRLRQSAPPVVPARVRPTDIRQARRRDRMPAA